jgi:hypothetical protein
MMLTIRLSMMKLRMLPQIVNFYMISDSESPGFKQSTNIRMPVLLLEQLPMREPDPGWTGHGGSAHIKEFHTIS